MQVDVHPTAAASYTRTLIQRGCPPHLAAVAGQILARSDHDEQPTLEEQALINRAYAHLRH